jgi:hypothetical protein
VAGNEYNRRIDVSLDQLFLQLEAACSWKPHIQNYAARQYWRVGVQECLN